MEKLIGCPFCGEKEEVKVRLMCLNGETDEPMVWDEDDGNVYTWFHCYGCDTDFYQDMPVHTPENMIKWWNTRKPMERIVERLEDLMKAEESDGEGMLEDNFTDGESCGKYSAYYKAIQIIKEEGAV